MVPHFTQSNSFNPHQNLSEADNYFYTHVTEEAPGLEESSRRTSLVVQRPRFHTRRARGKPSLVGELDLMHVSELRVCMSQLKIPRVSTKRHVSTGHSQFKNKKNQVTCSRSHSSLKAVAGCERGNEALEFALRTITQNCSQNQGPSSSHLR